MNSAIPIWSKQQCIDAYDELMLKIALSSYAEIDGQELIAENEKLKESQQFQITPLIEKNIHKIIRKQQRQDFAYRLGKGIYSAANKAAMFFFVLFIFLAATMFVSAEFRSTVYKLVFTNEKQYTLIELDNSTNLEFVGSEAYTWDHAFAPMMMPHGYRVSDVVNLTNFSRVSYTDGGDGYIDFFQSSSSSEGTIQVDTEDAQLVQTIIINDSEGILVSKNGLSTLVWHVGNSFLGLESNTDTETLIAIAKGIKLLK